MAFLLQEDFDKYKSETGGAIMQLQTAVMRLENENAELKAMVKANEQKSDKVMQQGPYDRIFTT